MKNLAAVLLSFAVMLLHACTYVPAVEPTDLSVLNEKTVTRSEIEAVIGEPLLSRDTNDGSINVYDYDRGAKGENESVPINDSDVARCLIEMGPLCILVVPVLQVGIWVSTPILYAIKVNEQEGYLTVAYDQQDHFIAYRAWGNAISPEDAYERHVKYSSPENASNMKKLKQRADSGEPNAMYQYANHLKIGSGSERIRWYCLAAHAGHAKSQYQLGRYHHHGYVIEKNPVQAYLWYTLSLATEQTKEVARQREKLTSNMSPLQIAQANHLVAEWEPNPADCQATGGENRTEKASATLLSRSSALETVALSANPTTASWNGKWFSKDGAWSLYLDVESGAFTGRVLRRGSDPFPVTGTISPDYMVAGRVEDERGALRGSLSGMFPNVSVYQDGRVQASFNLEQST